MRQHTTRNNRSAAREERVRARRLASLAFPLAFPPSFGHCRSCIHAEATECIQTRPFHDHTRDTYDIIASAARIMDTSRMHLVVVSSHNHTMCAMSEKS